MKESHFVVQTGSCDFFVRSNWRAAAQGRKQRLKVARISPIESRTQDQVLGFNPQGDVWLCVVVTHSAVMAIVTLYGHHVNRSLSYPINAKC